MTKQKRYVVKTLGCRANQYESSAYENQLEKIGFKRAKKGEKADICIVNTCTVTHGADKDSRYQVRKIARDYPESKVVVTGCSAENDPFAFLEMDEVHSTFGNEHKDQLLQHLLPEENLPEFSIERFEGHTRAFVKIQDGCNSFCSYCILPYVRGRSKSKSVDAIIREIQHLVENGYQEIVLTGINVGDFDGGDGTSDLADLVTICDQMDGLKRIRISSIDPDEVNEKLLNAITNGKKTCASMHIVLQSGSNRILKKMNRKYTRQMFIKAVRALKEANNFFTFTTDVIVGFPTEEDSDFQDTLDMVHEVQFAKVHVFPYSRRKRTRAYHFEGQVPNEIITKRKLRLIHEAEQASYKLRETFLGRSLNVLVESNHFGHTDNFLPVHLPEGNWKTNQLLSVQLLENAPDGLKGKVISAP